MDGWTASYILYHVYELITYFIQKLIVELDLTLHWKDYEFLPKRSDYTPEPIENITQILLDYDNEQLAMNLFEQLWKPDIIVGELIYKLSSVLLILGMKNIQYLSVLKRIHWLLKYT